MCDSSCQGGDSGGCSISSQDVSLNMRKASLNMRKATGTKIPQMCMKCREMPSQVLVRQQEPMCYECLAAQLQSKAHHAIKSKGLIAVGDTVMLAFSGGYSSAALLRFLAELRNPRVDRLERRKIAFTLHIVHVDDSPAWALPQRQREVHCASVRQAAEQYLCEGVQYHSLPLEDLYAQQEPRPELRQARLQELLQRVPDPSGWEDLVAHLRTRLLLETARKLGCSKVARGDCATRLATHVIAATAKGCGYSLPGDVQPVDARHGPGQPLFFYPLREVGRRELGILCDHLQLPRVEGSTKEAAAGGGGPASRRKGESLNALAATFVEALLSQNPGSVSNIVGTVAKVQSFPWNNPPNLHNRHTEKRLKNQLLLQQQQQQAKQADRAQQVHRQGNRAGAATSGERAQGLQGGEQEGVLLLPLLCPLCMAPLADDELASALTAQHAQQDALPNAGSAGSGASRTQPAEGGSAVRAPDRSVGVVGRESAEESAQLLVDPLAPPTGVSPDAQALEAMGEGVLPADLCQALDPPPVCCFSCRAQIVGLQLPPHESRAAAAASVAATLGGGPAGPTKLPGPAAGPLRSCNGILGMLPSGVQQDLRRLGAAGARAKGAVAGAGGVPLAGHEAGRGSGVECSMEALRAQIADFLIEDTE